jgi:hypothetical protein
LLGLGEKVDLKCGVVPAADWPGFSVKQDRAGLHRPGWPRELLGDLAPFLAESEKLERCVRIEWLEINNGVEEHVGRWLVDSAKRGWSHGHREAGVDLEEFVSQPPEQEEGLPWVGLVDQHEARDGGVGESPDLCPGSERVIGRGAWALRYPAFILGFAENEVDQIPGRFGMPGVNHHDLR